MASIMWKIFSAIITVMVLVIIPSSASAGKKPNSKFYWKRPSWVMPWLKGPNVCAVQEVSGSRKQYYSECMAYRPRKIGMKPTFIRYQCCNGFEQTDNANGQENDCNGVSIVENLLNTMQNLHLSTFRKHAVNSNMAEKLSNDGAFTLFIPENSAFLQMSQSERKLLEMKRARSELLKHHVTKDRHKLRDLRNGMKLASMSQQHGSLRINRYSNGVVTVNCARIIIPDQIATNGIIHIVEKVITPVPTRNTIMEILLLERRFEFGELASALLVANLDNMLRDEDKMFTFFAPTDFAFRNAPQDVIDKIVNDKNALERLLKYHLMDGPLCSAAILTHNVQRTIEGQKVNLTCGVNDELQMNGMNVNTADILALNGIIHVIDHLIIPNSVKSLHSVMEGLELFEYLKYSRQVAELNDVLNGRLPTNYTVFVPDDQAFKMMSTEERMILETSKAALRLVMKHHIVPEAIITTGSMRGDQALLTLATNDDNLHVSVHNQGISVNGANIVSSDNMAINGYVHVIDRVLFPLEDTVIEKVKAEARLSTFLTALQTVNLDSVLLDVDRSFTVFAPTNDAFDVMPSAYIDALMTDRDRLTLFLQYHIVSSRVYTSLMEHMWQYKHNTLTGERLHIQLKNHQGEENAYVINNRTRITDGPVPSINGNMYIVDEALLCPCLE